MVTCRDDSGPLERGARPIVPAWMLLLVLVLITACDTGPGEESVQAPPTATASPSAGEDLPAGYTLREGAGFSVALPEEFVPPPEDRRLEGPALEVGVEFTGQPYPPLQFYAFIERGQVGPLGVSEPLLRAKLKGRLPEDATFGDSQQVDIEGALDAIEFEVQYTTVGGITSYLDTPLDPTPIRQVELLFETEGSPKFGFRYQAPADQFSDETWRTIRDSISVGPGEVPEQGGATGEGD